MRRKLVIWLCMLAAYVAGLGTLPTVFVLAMTLFPGDDGSCPVSEQRWTPEAGWQERCLQSPPPIRIPDNVAGLVGSSNLVAR